MFKVLSKLGTRAMDGSVPKLMFYNLPYLLHCFRFLAYFYASVFISGMSSRSPCGELYMRGMCGLTKPL